MNDRSVSLLDNYDIEVLRTRKGRGAILCETAQGLFIFKEYAGHEEKAVFQDTLLTLVKDNGFQNVESILKNKEQELITRDQEGTSYVLKTYFEGRECNVRDREECQEAVRMLARLHNAASAPEDLPAPSPRSAFLEFEKHNRELRRVRKFLKGKSQMADFEICLLQSYDYFFQLALQITEELRLYPSDGKRNTICHGDYQYHNILVSEGKMYLINFEKCAVESPVRDLYLFMRKLLEKSGWEESVGMELVNAYHQVRALEKEEYRQLYYRLAYPEKFWKIVNFYYNNKKSWIPDKNLEKLSKVIGQEKEKQIFLEKFKNRYGL